MDPVEYDVYISCRPGAGQELAATIASGLRRRGFRVFDGGAETGSRTAEQLRKIIEEAPDFVAVVTPGAPEAGDRFETEIAQAVRTERNIVPVAAPGCDRPGADAFAPGRAAIGSRDVIRYSVRSSDESIARIAHRLSSDATVDERHMLRQAKWIGWFTGLVLLAVVAVVGVGALSKMFAPRVDERPLPPMVLHWSAFGQHVEAGRVVEVAVRDGGRLASGDELRVMFSANADAFAYVVARDTRGGITMLFPSAGSDASRVRAGEIYQAPADGGWFAATDAAGLEALYVIASYDPIENLESLLQEHREQASGESREALLDSTIGGLLDGRHAGAAGRARARSGRPIAESADAGPRLAAVSTTLDGGVQVTHTAAMQPGLVSAMAEIHFK